MRVRYSTYILLALSLLSFAPLTHAESVLWTTEFKNAFAGSCDTNQSQLTSAQVSVEYHVEVLDADTGLPLASGSTVPTGTRVLYHFIPHDVADINWFLTGYAWDSPYGSWVKEAAPTGDYEPSFCGLGNLADISVDPPQESVTGLPSSCSTESDGVSKLCALADPGTVAASFVFAGTKAQYYNYSAVTYRPGDPLGQPSGPGAASAGPLLTVPAETISHTIIVAGSSDGTTSSTNGIAGAPSTPALAASGAAGATSCTTSSPYTITMAATDPDGDQLRYLVDWDADGTVDELVPASGYVPSGTQETASRTNSLAGSKTVKVKAQDSNGNTSGWASLSFTCAASSDETGTGDLNGGLGNGDTGAGTPAPDLSVRVIPSLVAKGTTTHVNWSVANVKLCTVTGQNGDSWTGLQSVIGGETSGPITQTTQYTLTCLDPSGDALTQTATVTILPTFQEQ